MGRISTYLQVSIDEYSFVINPVLLGRGKNAFAGIDNRRARSVRGSLVRARPRLGHVAPTLTWPSTG